MIRLNRFRVLWPKILRFQTQFRNPTRYYENKTPCYIGLKLPDKKPCFDLKSVSVELGNSCHAKAIRSFLYTHYWTREPSVVALWLPLNSSYLDVLTEKYSNSGDRFLAYERLSRTKEHKLVGVCVINKVYPWVSSELDEWAHFTPSKPERNRLYFLSHCYRSPNIFNKYNVQYIYDVEVLATASEVGGQGVGTRLLTTVLEHAEELRHPLVHVIAISKYTCNICEKAGMKRAWTMDYTEFVDNNGQKVFFPRRPHSKVSVYVKYNDPAAPPVLD
ncbi:hypothetical protein ACJJTC_011478 [Scirpophaga incertulas]